MAAPGEIIDTLETILGIFLSDIRHRERAAFILCDNLVEMTCKTKARQHDYTFNTSCGFHDAWKAPGVSLAPEDIGRRVQDRRYTRNNIQHENAAITVDTKHCADAILDAVRVIDICWSQTSVRQFSEWVKCTLRIIRLYSSAGDPLKHQPFEDVMRGVNWRGEGRTSVRVSERQIEPGLRAFWWLAVREHTPLVESCLNEIEID